MVQSPNATRAPAPTRRTHLADRNGNPICHQPHRHPLPTTTRRARITCTACAATVDRLAWLCEALHDDPAALHVMATTR